MNFVIFAAFFIFNTFGMEKNRAYKHEQENHTKKWLWFNKYFKINRYVFNNYYLLLDIGISKSYKNIIRKYSSKRKEYARIICILLQ